MPDDDKVTFFGPARDRRSGKRYLTLRNAGILVVVLVGVFALISIAGEFRPTDGSYGRLYDRRTIEIEAQPRAPMEVVGESSIDDQKAADPMLLDSLSREAMLGVTPEMMPGATQATTTSAAVTGIAPIRPLNVPKNGKVVITGGADGVQMKVQQ